MRFVAGPLTRVPASSRVLLSRCGRNHGLTRSQSRKLFGSTTRPARAADTPRSLGTAYGHGSRGSAGRDHLADLQHHYDDDGPLVSQGAPGSGSRRQSVSILGALQSRRVRSRNGGKRSVPATALRACFTAPFLLCRSRGRTGREVARRVAGPGRTPAGGATAKEGREVVMFVARGIVVCLAFFAVMYGTVSVLVGSTWWLNQRLLRQSLSSPSLLFGLRIFPFALSTVVAVFFTFPSFWLMERKSLDEEATTFCLATCALVLLAAGLVRALRAAALTNRALRQWSRESNVGNESDGPSLSAANGAPALMLVGVCRP